MTVGQQALFYHIEGEFRPPPLVHSCFSVVGLAWILFDQGLNSLQLAGCALIILAGIAQALLLNRRSEAEEMPGMRADLDSTVP